MVNTALRRAGGHYAWATAVVYSGTLGGALHNEWCLHFGDHFRPIPHDLVPARLAFFQPRSVVANRRARPRRDADGAARFLDFALARRPDQKSLSSRRGRV